MRDQLAGSGSDLQNTSNVVDLQCCQSLVNKSCDPLNVMQVRRSDPDIRERDVLLHYSAARR